MEDNLKHLAQLHDENIELKKQLKGCKKQITELNNKLFNERKEIERLKAEREWISVNDRLPEDNETVLVTDGNRVKEVWFWNITKLDKPRFVFTSMPDDTITHWMPLPEPPKQ